MGNIIVDKLGGLIMHKFHNIEEKVIFEKLTSKHIGISESINKNSNSNSNTVNHNAFDANKILNHFEEINLYIKTLENTRQNYAYRPIVSYRKYIDKLLVFGKKVLRRLIKFYVEPIAFQQTEFNNAVTPIIGRMTEIQNELLKGVTLLQNENTNLKVELDSKQSEIVGKLEEINSYKNNNNLDKELEEIKSYNNKLEMKLEEIKSYNIELEMGLEKIKCYNNKSDVEFEEIKNQYTRLEGTLLARMDENLRTQEVANNQIRHNEQKLKKLEDLDLDLFKEKQFNFWDKKTVSQSGEDAICAYINMALGRPLEQCTYLDLGANHAKDLSNTYLFYSHGARGILVEANPTLIPELKFYRNGDIVLNKCISTKSGDYVDFHILNGDGLSTPDLDSANEFIAKNSDLKIIDTVKVETISVNDIMENYLGKAPVIMNIDIEGKDLEVLESIDFIKYRPLIIIAEMIEYKPTLVVASRNSKITEFMENNEYIEYAFTGINSIFIDKKQIEEV